MCFRHYNRGVSESATKADLEQFKSDILTAIRTAFQETETRFRTALQETETRFRTALQETETGFQTALHDTETKLLKAFFAYQEHADVRFRKMTADVSNINASSELRLNNLEQRVIELEKNFLMGPQ